MLMYEDRSSEFLQKKNSDIQIPKTKISENRNVLKKIQSPTEFKISAQHQLNVQSPVKVLPIPLGDNPYALAKQAEYKQQDYQMAEFYYKQAINTGDRTESAIKDLASLYHQRGKTAEACKLLEDYRHLFVNNIERYQNLYNTIYKQLDETASSLSRIIKVSCLMKSDNLEKVKTLFNNSPRILHVSLGNEEEEDGDTNYYAILRFNSHSSARKALESFRNWGRYRVEWINKDGDVLGDAHYARHKMEEYRKANPTFEYIIFDRDPKGYVLSLPIDGHGSRVKEEFSEGELALKVLIGSELYDSVFNIIEMQPISILHSQVNAN